MTKAYVFDTYALIEIIKGNKNYNGYLDSKIIITAFILAELCHNSIKLYGNKRAYEYVDLYSKFVQNIDKEVIKEAMNFRFLNKKNGLSMADVVGYALAKKLNIKFLTGDKEFKDLPNVEFVK